MMSEATLKDALDFHRDGVKLMKTLLSSFSSNEPLKNVTGSPDFIHRAQRVFAPLLAPRNPPQSSRGPEETAQRTLERDSVGVSGKDGFEEAVQSGVEAVEDTAQSGVEGVVEDDVQQNIGGSAEGRAAEGVDVSNGTSQTVGKVAKRGAELPEREFYVEDESKTMLNNSPSCFWSTSLEAEISPDFWSKGLYVAYAVRVSGILFRFYCFAAYEHFYEFCPEARNITIARTGDFIRHVGGDTTKGKDFQELLRAGKKLHDAYIHIRGTKRIEQAERRPNIWYAFLTLPNHADLM